MIIAFPGFDGGLWVVLWSAPAGHEKGPGAVARGAHCRDILSRYVSDTNRARD